MMTAIYARVSTEEQAKKHSIGAQLDLLRDYAKRNSYMVYKEYIDPGYSGSVDDRPAYQELLKDALKGKFKCVLVYKVDRLFRNTRQLLNVVYELETENVSVKSVTEPFDTGTSAGKFMSQLLSSIAELEKNIFKERSAVGMLKRLQKGLYWGRAPFGYDYSKDTGMLKINEQEAKIVRNIFSEYCKPNSSLGRTSRAINAQGARTKLGHKWRTDGIHSVLARTVYKGEYCYNKIGGAATNEKEWIKNDTLRIIPDDIFENAQELLKRRSTHRPGGNKKYKYLLSGYFYCSECGSVMGGSTTSSCWTVKGKKYGPYTSRLYRCSGRARRYFEDTKKEKRNCKMGSVRIDDMDAFIWGLVERIITNPQTIMDILKQKPSLDKKNIEKKMDVIKKRIDRLDKERKRVIYLYRKELVTELEFTEQIEGINTEKQMLLEKTTNLHELILTKETNVIKTISGLDKMLKKEMGALNMEQKREVISLLIRRIEIDSDGVLKIFFMIPGLPALQQEFSYFKAGK